MSFKVGGSSGGVFETPPEGAQNKKGKQKLSKEQKGKENILDATGKIAEEKIVKEVGSETKKPATTFKATEKRTKTEQKVHPVIENLESFSQESHRAVNKLFGAALSYQTGYPIENPGELNPKALAEYEDKVKIVDQELLKAIIDSGCDKILPPPGKRKQEDYDNLKFQLYQILANQVVQHPTFRSIGKVAFDPAKSKFYTQKESAVPFYENLMHYTLVNALNRAVDSLQHYEKNPGELNKEKPAVVPQEEKTSNHPGWRDIQFLAFLPKPEDLTRQTFGRFSERYIQSHSR